jgi:hypothetical protein
MSCSRERIGYSSTIEHKDVSAEGWVPTHSKVDQEKKEAKKKKNMVRALHNVRTDQGMHAQPPVFTTRMQFPKSGVKLMRVGKWDICVPLA